MSGLSGDRAVGWDGGDASLQMTQAYCHMVYQLLRMLHVVGACAALSQDGTQGWRVHQAGMLKCYMYCLCAVSFALLHLLVQPLPAVSPHSWRQQDLPSGARLWTGAPAKGASCGSTRWTSWLGSWHPRSWCCRRLQSSCLGTCSAMRAEEISSRHFLMGASNRRSETVALVAATYLHQARRGTAQAGCRRSIAGARPVLQSTCALKGCAVVTNAFKTL